MKQLGHLRSGVVLVRPLVPARVCKEVATQLRAQGGSQGARRAPGPRLVATHARGGAPCGRRRGWGGGVASPRQGRESGSAGLLGAVTKYREEGGDLGNSNYLPTGLEA